MILKGSQRGGATQLGLHLMRLDENDHVEVHEVRGFLSADPLGAFREAQALSRATKCLQYLFSVSLSPPSSEDVSVAEFERAVNGLEAKLGLTGQPRVLVFHEKSGRRHAHCVWSRIDADELKAINLPYFKRKLVEHSRELFLEHGWRMPRGLVASEERNLVQTVHSDLRPMIVLHLPPDLEDFPLGTDARSMELREKARGYYERAASVLSSLQRNKAASLAADYALWLALMNPATKPTALIELRSSMADARLRLRRLPLALAFGLELDIPAVEREIDSETALTGGTSVEASIARFALATFRKKPAETVEYIRKYRDVLGYYYTQDFIDGIEVEGLARSGQVSEATVKLQELRERGFPKTGLDALGRVLDEAAGADPVIVRQAQYQSTKSLADLISLVQILRTRRVHSLLVLYPLNPDTGMKVARVNPQSEWVTKAVPELQIIDRETWDAVQANRLGVRESTAKFWQKQRPKYLFSGKLRCGCCGGAVTKISATHYGCSTARNKGDALCANRRTVSRTDLEHTVLQVLKNRLMDPALVAEFCAEYTSHINRLRIEQNASLSGYRAELKKLDAREQQMVNAIMDGYASPKLKSEMDANLARQGELKRLIDGTAEAPVLLHPTMSERYRTEVVNLVAALNDDSKRHEATELIRSLIDNVVVTPSGLYAMQIDVHGDIAGILNVASPTNGRKDNEPDFRQIRLMLGASTAADSVKQGKVVGLEGSHLDFNRRAAGPQSDQSVPYLPSYDKKQVKVVELSGIEPLASSLRTMRSPN